MEAVIYSIAKRPWTIVSHGREIGRLNDDNNEKRCNVFVRTANKIGWTQQIEVPLTTSYLPNLISHPNTTWICHSYTKGSHVQYKISGKPTSVLSAKLVALHFHVEANKYKFSTLIPCSWAVVNHSYTILTVSKTDIVSTRGNILLSDKRSHMDFVEIRILQSWQHGLVCTHKMEPWNQLAHPPI